MAELIIESGLYSGDATLCLIGDFDKNGTEKFKDAMEQATAMDSPRIYLDLSQLKSIDSMGLGILIYNFSYLKNSGRELVILNPSSEMRELLEISCLDKLITIEVSP
jgi:anti-anti-sigma factor